MSKSDNLTDYFEDLAGVIRAKEGSTALISPQDMAQRIGAIGGNRATSGTLSKSYNGEVYYFRIRNGNSLLLDWYPCRRKSDGVEGFWDCVVQKFVEPIN